MPNHDKATTLSLNYLQAIENRLNITWNAQSQPVCVIDRIDDASIDSLRDELGDLLSGTSSDDARQAAAKYGGEHIQTVGFGQASDFDQFVKLGFLCGERVVLWDVIGSRILVEKDATPRLKSVLASAACGLLLLRPVVERGGLVLLPHPIAWSALAKSVDANLRTGGNRSAATLGLWMALSAIEEGLPLHPYTLLTSGQKPTAQEEVNAHEGNLYSPENYIFHGAITSLLRDQRLAYVQGVTAAAFYQIVSKHTELQRALRKHFVSGLSGLSPQQAQKELDDLTEDLVKLIGKRNKELREYAAEGGEATVAFALASMTALNSVPALGALDALAIGGIAAPLSIAVRKWLKTPEKNVIVQAFQEAREQEQVERAPLPYSGGAGVTNKAAIDESVLEIYDEFMSFSWTEERHDYLKSLPPDVAHRLLRVLNSDDLEVIVNYRRFQHDYIGDYLKDLWELDEESFWEHIGKTFESPEGLLVYDHDAHIQVMCSYDMPQRVWMLLLSSILGAYRGQLVERKADYAVDVLSEIVYFQTEKATKRQERREALSEWFKTLAGEDRELVLWFLGLAYKEGLPQWFLGAVRL